MVEVFVNKVHSVQDRALLQNLVHLVLIAVEQDYLLRLETVQRDTTALEALYPLLQPTEKLEMNAPKDPTAL